MACLVAIGVAASGERRVLGLDLAASNDEGNAWAGFVRGLLERGLCGVRLVISDAQRGIVEAVHAQLLGAGLAALIGPHCPGTRRSRLAPGGECLGNDDRLRSSGRPAPPPGWRAPPARGRCASSTDR